jgi:hypothetical protein
VAFFKDRIEYEEELLVEFFGKEYIEYKMKTPVWIPFCKGFEAPLMAPESCLVETTMATVSPSMATDVFRTDFSVKMSAPFSSSSCHAPWRVMYVLNASGSTTLRALILSSSSPAVGPEGHPAILHRLPVAPAETKPWRPRGARFHFGD